MILVTGANGQLGQCLKKELKVNTALFKSKSELDITNLRALTDFLAKNNIDTIINCAAYTNVDKSEEEIEISNLINHTGVKNLALAAKKTKIKLIHISTDYVFDGSQNIPYKESDRPCPLGQYGQSKLNGENAVSVETDIFAIIRTSWLYSEFNKNFVKTMHKLLNEKDELGIVFDQVGSPTYARDLAKSIKEIIPQLNKDNSGVYHFSNQGITSWYDLTVEIQSVLNSNCILNPIESHEYPTPARRPHYTAFNTKKIKETFNIKIPHWKESLKLCLQRIS